MAVSVGFMPTALTCHIQSCCRSPERLDFIRFEEEVLHHLPLRAAFVGAHCWLWALKSPRSRTGGGSWPIRLSSSVILYATEGGTGKICGTRENYCSVVVLADTNIHRVRATGSEASQSPSEVCCCRLRLPISGHCYVSVHRTVVLYLFDHLVHIFLFQLECYVKLVGVYSGILVLCG